MPTKLFFLKRVTSALIALCAFAGLATTASKAQATTKPDLSVEQRIADVRAKFEKLKNQNTDEANKIKGKSHLAQWYNFPNWPNWNDWRNWPNHRWLNW